jgi:multicomponent Na+:H+ antiporter subunit E
MLRAISLFVVLMGLWLLLSGHYTPLITGFGVLSCALAVYIAFRMDIIDREGHPVHLSWRAPVYWLWLAWEIVKSNIEVALRCIRPGPPIAPLIVDAPVSQHSDLGIVTYANSITLTPGTVAMETFSDHIVVHALTQGFADGLLSGTMDRYVSLVEGGAGHPPAGEDPA